MNHDATHCADMRKDCPMSCYRAQLTRELMVTSRLQGKAFPVSWAHLHGTVECPKKGGDAR